MTAGGAVAAMQGRIIRAFAEADAFSESSAKSLDELGLRTFARGMFDRMERQGIIIRAGGDRFYMDKEYYDARQRRLRIVAPVVAVAMIVAVICIFIFTR